MFKSPSILVCLGIILLLPGVLHAKTLEVDLATFRDLSFVVDPGTELEFELINRVPTKAYSVQIAVSRTDLGAQPPPSSGQGGQPEAQRSPCEETAVNILDVQDESAVAQAVTKGRNQLEQKVCGLPTHIATLQSAIDNTRQILPGLYSLESGDELVIHISRDTGEVAREWKITITTRQRGQWLGSYGFVFTPNEDETFFSKPVGEGKFQIFPETDEKSDLEDLDFAPSFFYTWLPRKYESKSWSPGWTFGLGFDQTDPIVFVGGSLYRKRFVSLVGGIVLHRQKHLNGQYSPMQEVMENLSADQLHESSYGVNYFLGVSFRFNSNPFSRNGDNGQAGVRPTPATSD